MKVTQEILQSYARLIARSGANVRPGQVVQLSISVEQAPFALLLAEECYEAGAKKVNVEWQSDGLSRLHFQYAAQETLGTVLPWEEAKAKQMVEDLPCRIYIASEDPDALAGISPDKLSFVGRSRARVLKRYRNAIDGKHQWTIAAYPSEKWAKKCFPEDEAETAVQKLWDAVLKTVRIDGEHDPVAAWKAHSDFITAKAAWLNEQGFRFLRYSSANGTDFTVELIPGAHWEGAGAVNKVNGAAYIPNMPTEEIFTAPDRNRCEGVIYAALPLSKDGNVIENIRFVVKDGQIVEASATANEELLRKSIAVDEGASRFGEVALVPYDSPISNSKTLFYNTLFDENAACHLAFGEAYPMTVEGALDMSEEERRAHGLNTSITHVDFMVGTADLSIDGYTADGRCVPVFRDGNFVF